MVARPFRNSAGMELYADLGVTIHTLNGNGKFDAQAIGNGPSPMTPRPSPMALTHLTLRGPPIYLTGSRTEATS